MVISVRLCSFLWESKWKWRESFRLCRQIIMAVKLLMNQTYKMRVGSVIFRGERRGEDIPLHSHSNADLQVFARLFEQKRFSK